MKAQLTEHVWAQDWNGQYVLISSGTPGTVDYEPIPTFTTLNGMWVFPVQPEEYKLTN